MQAMKKCPTGGQQTYDVATMYTQLKLFADPPADPNDLQHGGNSETESEDELELWELRRKRQARGQEMDRRSTTWA